MVTAQVIGKDMYNLWLIKNKVALLTLLKVFVFYLKLF